MRYPHGHSNGPAWIRRCRRVGVIALFAAACGASAGSVGAQELPADPPAALRPLDLILDHQQQLELTDQQLAQLDRIRERLVRTNEPLVRRMLTLRRQWQRQRLLSSPDPVRLARIRSAAEPVHARIQSNNRTAMQAVNRLLTRPQRQRLRAIVKDRREQGDAEPAASDEPDAAGQH